jgi:hypothetical protein
MFLHHGHNLVDSELRAHTLWRATDGRGTTPTSLESVELRKRRLDVREPARELADRKLLARLARPLPETRVERDYYWSKGIPNAESSTMRTLYHRNEAKGDHLVPDSSAFESGDHVDPLPLDLCAILFGFLTREQPQLHRGNTVSQRNPEVHDCCRDRREMAGRLGRRRLLYPRVVPGREGLRARVAATRELVRGGDHRDSLHRGLEAFAIRPEIEERHRSDRVEIGANRRESRALGRKLRRQRVLDGRTIGVTARVLGVDVEGATLCERGHCHFDPIDGVSEHLVVGLRGSRNVAGVESCEAVNHDNELQMIGLRKQLYHIFLFLSIGVVCIVFYSL